MTPQRGVGPPRGIVNPHRSIVLRMRTHSYSIAVHHYDGGLWSVAVVRSTFKAGVLVNRDLVEGPTWPSAGSLGDALRDYAAQMESQVREDY